VNSKEPAIVVAASIRCPSCGKFVSGKTAKVIGRYVLGEIQAITSVVVACPRCGEQDVVTQGGAWWWEGEYE